MKRCSSSLAIREMQITAIMIGPCVSIGTAKVKNQINAGKDVERLDHSDIAGGNVKWSGHSGK